MLERYSQYLTERGVFIVRIYDITGKYKAIVDMIDRNYDVVETCLYQNSQVLVLAFRPRLWRT